MISHNSNTFQCLFLITFLLYYKHFCYGAVKSRSLINTSMHVHALVCVHVHACMHVCVVAKRLSVQQTGGCQVAASPITGTELSCRCEQLLILLQCTLKEPRSQAKQQHPT